VWHRLQHGRLLAAISRRTFLAGALATGASISFSSRRRVPSRRSSRSLRARRCPDAGNTVACNPSMTTAAVADRATDELVAFDVGVIF
jgi:hypothetical protein